MKLKNIVLERKRQDFVTRVMLCGDTELDLSALPGLLDSKKFLAMGFGLINLVMAYAQ